MAKYILSRLLEAVVAVFGLVTLIFLVSRLLGDPVSLLLPQGASAGDLQAMREQLGLQRPLPEQYLRFLGQALSGDFGQSFFYQHSAMRIVLERMPATLLLAALSALFGIIGGCLAGMIAARYRNSFWEFLVLTCAMLGQATPAFWLAIMMILLFSVDLGWLPTGGTGSPLHLVLPTAVMSIFVAANISRLFRSSLLDVMSEDYVRTAQAKGLSPRVIMTWHMARNAMLPVVTLSGLLVGEMLGGSVVVETIFSWPGVGRLIVEAVANRDFPLIQAGVMVVSCLYLLVSLAVDLLYSLLDPRVRQTR
ncbi:ABC transporter permease [Acerihabitans arboris]|uniref:ABC transporter permease subunit n=1 Tax=Acerihabitans arboris TaxID=2691583 RepID=A0A845SHQ6_9GAMM|nr:ABC transporter permease [Acerihabitans arboris]NDL62151.1 ABC transporter permease subunit [Acerihabitans arboris]